MSDKKGEIVNLPTSVGTYPTYAQMPEERNRKEPIWYALKLADECKRLEGLIRNLESRLEIKDIIISNLKKQCNCNK